LNQLVDGDGAVSIGVEYAAPPKRQVPEGNVHADNELV
jgi:hypothetical protein